MHREIIGCEFVVCGGYVGQRGTWWCWYDWVVGWVFIVTVIGGGIAIEFLLYNCKGNGKYAAINAQD